MTQRRIKLKIFPDGQIQAEVLGFQGRKCADYISILEEMLEAEAIDSARTPEYFLEETTMDSTEIPITRVDSISRGE